MTPQQKRVLAAAREYDGTCQADWVQEMGADGRGKITRLAARIGELDELGYRFECIGWRNRCKVWRLVDVERGAGVPPVQGPVQGATVGSSLGTERLFAPPATPHYDEAA